MEKVATCKCGCQSWQIMEFKKGNYVKMTENALENYGEQYRNVVFMITHCANKSMPADEFFTKGKPEGYHVGYDQSAYPMGLYDLVIVKTKKGACNESFTLLPAPKGRGL